MTTPSDTPIVGSIVFSSISNPNTWSIEGDPKCLVFASPSEAKRAEELFQAMQRDLAAAQERVRELESALARVTAIAAREGK